MVASAGLAQQAGSLIGTITGSLTGEDGTAISGGTISLHLSAPAPSRIVRQTTEWTAVTGTAGAFQFTSLPEGRYTVCARVQNSAWLNPCEWNFPTPTATISRTNPVANVTITLKRGAVIPVRIDDTGQLLAKNEGKTPGAGFLLTVLSPGYIFRLVPLVSQDSNGRNHQIVVPFNTPLTLVVHPSFYHVNDGYGVSLAKNASTKIPLLVAAGQQVSPIKFTISGAGP
jgi:hypothetical protein